MKTCQMLIVHPVTAEIFYKYCIDIISNLKKVISTH